MEFIKTRKSSISKLLAFVLLAMTFLPYIPTNIISKADNHEVVYNTKPAYHYDGSLFEQGQWFGFYLVGGFLSEHDNNLRISKWLNAHVPGKVPIALTNFTVPDMGVKLNTAAFCIKPIAPNWPNTIHVYEITPELCNDFSDVTERKITERDIDALNVAMRTLGFNKNGVNFSNDNYAAMRFVCWYVGAMGWQSKEQFMQGIDEVKIILGPTVNSSKFVSLCNKTADAIEKSIGAIDTGYTEYMPAFAGRYSNQVPEIEFTDSSGDGVYTYTYNYSRPYDKDWTYTCPSGITAEYTSSSVTFKSSTPKPEDLIEGSIKSGSKLNDVVPSGGILICKSDDPEAQDMLIPYNAETELICYVRASSGGDGGGGSSEFPSLQDVRFYKYDETFEASYNIFGEKFDAETSKT